MRKEAISRWLLVGISAVGVLGVAQISYSQFAGLAQCPQLGMIPACYIVLACYTLILIAAVYRRAMPAWVFWIGWFGVFATAMSGTALELGGTQTCPRTASGTPTCYFSLAIAIVLALLFIISFEENRCKVR
jgi:hypothetical protein